METPHYEPMNTETSTGSETSPLVEVVRASPSRVLPLRHHAQNMDEYGYVARHPRVSGYSPLNE